MSRNPPHAPPRARRRVALALALVAASVLLHLLLLAWLDGRLERAGAADVRKNAPVEIVLLARPEPAPQPRAAPASEPAPEPARPRAPAPRPAPRPAAITMPLPSVAVEPAVAAASEPLADIVAPARDDAGPAADAAAADARPAAPAPMAEAAPQTADAPAAADAAAPSDGIASPHYGRPLPLPPAGRWSFGVFYGDYVERHRVATLDYSIAHDGRRYRLATEGKAEGLTALLYSGVLTQTSTGRLSDNGLEPERYSEQRGKRAERWAAVDHAGRRVSFGSSEPVDYVEGAQDRLSVLVQIGLVARVLPERFAAGSVFEIPELTLRSVERARYASRGEVALETEQGPIRALHLERVGPRDRDDARIEVWLGYDRAMLPVRIRLTDPGGRVLDQMIQP